METATLPGAPADDAPAPDVTGPEIVPVDLPPRAKVLSHRPMPLTALMVVGLAGIGLAALIGGAANLVARRFSSPVLRHG
jgi:hypothetical protein